MESKTIWGKVIDVWQVACACVAILVTIALFCVSAIAATHDEVKLNTQKISVLERRGDQTDSYIITSSERLRSIEIQQARQMTILEQIEKNTKR